MNTDSKKLDDMLAAFDKDRHGGEAMAFAPVGREFPAEVVQAQMKKGQP